MYRHMATAALVSIFISSCATANTYEQSEAVTSRLAEFEATGDTQSCITTSRINSITALDERNFLVRVGVSNYYLNKVERSCNGADDTFNRIQYKVSGGSLCRNQIIEIVDNSSGFTVGTCGLGSFEELEKIPKDAR